MATTDVAIGEGTSTLALEEAGGAMHGNIYRIDRDLVLTGIQAELDALGVVHYVVYTATEEDGEYELAGNSFAGWMSGWGRLTSGPINLFLAEGTYALIAAFSLLEFASTAVEDGVGAVPEIGEVLGAFVSPVSTIPQGLQQTSSSDVTTVLQQTLTILPAPSE